MLSLSYSTFRDRWQLFLGAIVTVALAVALCQATLLGLITAATADVPDDLPETEQLALSEGYESAVALFGIIEGIAFFVSIFIVSGTFAFVVAQRRRELALLRLVGAERRQVRRLLLGESLLLGTIATAVGIPAGLVVARVQDWMLTRFGLVPEGFATEWCMWILGVSAGVGIVVAALAVLMAAHRAGRVRPLEALRGSQQVDRAMTPSRWIVGAIAIAGAIAMVIVAPHAGADGALALSINVCLVAVIALAAWSPLVVPLVSALVISVARVVAPRSPIRELVSGNLRTGVRRSAATATPIIVLTGLVVGIAGAMAVMEKAARVELTDASTSDVSAVSDDWITPELTGVPGVEVVSEEIEAVVHVQAADSGDEALSDEAIVGLGIEPATYDRTHSVTPEDGSLTDLEGPAIAVDSSLASRMRVELGDETPVRIGDRDIVVEVVAILPTSLIATDEAWVPISLLDGVSPNALGEHSAAINTVDAVATDQVIATLVDAGIDAEPTADAIEATLEETNRNNRNIQIALLGLSGLFTMVAIVNAVVIAASDRRAEFATLRLTGFTRGQVVRAALWESAAVVVAGLTLGVVAASGTIVGMTLYASDVVGEQIVALPWEVWAMTAAVVAALVATTSALTTRSATTVAPIAAAGARE